MQWSSGRNAGFSQAALERLFLPVISDPVYGYQTINVEAQLRTPASLFHWLKRLIAVRKQYPAFGRGSLELLYPANPRILAYITQYDSEAVLVVNNLSRSAQSVELDLSRLRGAPLVELINNVQFPAIGERPYVFHLAPYGFCWFRLRSGAKPSGS
jgi:maltose alpha-D-glucosyltransferase/alpha-amylase